MDPMGHGDFPIRYVQIVKKASSSCPLRWGEALEFNENVGLLWPAYGGFNGIYSWLMGSIADL